MGSRAMISVGAALVLVLGACGDDDDSESAATGAPAADTTEGAADETTAETTAATAESTTGGSAAEGDELCALATEMYEQEDFPSVEQLQRYQELAPDEIADAVNQLAEPMIASGDDVVALLNVVAEDDNEAANEEINAFEEETCGIPHSEDSVMPEGATREIEADAARVDVTATDFAFAIGEVAPGRTSFALTNDGAEAHFMLVVKLAEGVTLEQAMQSEGEEGTIDGEWETNLAAAGGDEEVITFDVEPGNYALLCFLPTTDGTPHAELGMQHEFTVS